MIKVGIYIYRSLPNAVESFKNCAKISMMTYILSTAPWNMPISWTHKRQWVSKYLGNNAYKRLILSNHKNLLRGDYLIDDRTVNGASEFDGELIQFGVGEHSNWQEILNILKP